MTKQILLVDDEEHILRLLDYHLGKEGFSTQLVTDGRKALTLAETEPFDFILLDIMLPQLDGIEVCKRLRAKGIKTPIMMVSAKSDEFDKVLALELGADDYLTKPFSLENCWRVSRLFYVEPVKSSKKMTQMISGMIIGYLGP